MNNNSTYNINLIKPPPVKQKAPKELSIEEQEKELLYWESQYDTMFDKLEKKAARIHMYKSLFTIISRPNPHKN
jgi:hypothetical protein|tara:strand:+ start:2981 stop:3202 length:222 start_codon:yes stop_codon:yes gene_type:complete